MAKLKLPICQKCGQECEVPCAAAEELFKIYNDLRTEEKQNIIKELRKELSMADYEVADDLRELAEKVIAARPELNIIRDYDIKVAYVRSYEAKGSKGKSVNADCRMVNGVYTAFLPYDFIITFYEPNMYYMTENQQKVLMLHELKHIGIGERGLRIENHDIEDFKDILTTYGLEWNGLDADVPDILQVGGDSGTKGNKMAAKPKTNSNS
jgi:predicted metallopeptidase